MLTSFFHAFVPFEVILSVLLYDKNSPLFDIFLDPLSSSTGTVVFGSNSKFMKVLSHGKPALRSGIDFYSINQDYQVNQGSIVESEHQVGNILEHNQTIEIPFEQQVVSIVAEVGSRTPYIERMCNIRGSIILRKLV